MKKLGDLQESKNLAQCMSTWPGWYFVQTQQLYKQNELLCYLDRQKKKLEFKNFKAKWSKKKRPKKIYKKKV